MFRTTFLIALCSLTMVSCDSGGENTSPPVEIESDVGEAVIRHLITKLPDPAPDVPKVYSIVKGEIYTRGVVSPVAVAFHDRFSDLKLRFVSANALEDTEPDHLIIDSQSRLAPYLLQVRKLVKKGDASYEAEVGWSYKKLFERWRYAVETREGKTAVTGEERLEGNWEKP
jgi:hypothetical protein